MPHRSLVFMSDNDTCTPHRLVFFFFFFQERVWNKRIYLETSNNRPATLCVLNAPFSWSLCNLHPSLWQFSSGCVCVKHRYSSMRLSNQGLDLTDLSGWVGCLKIVPSLHDYSSLLSLWGTAISAIRSAADFKNSEGQTWISLVASPSAPSVPSPVEECTEAIARRYIWLHFLQSGGQQVLVLVHLLDFSFTGSQHRQPLRAGGDPAGSVEDQTQKKEEDGDKCVAGNGHQRSFGQSCCTLFRFHNEDWTAVSSVGKL